MKKNKKIVIGAIIAVLVIGLGVKLYLRSAKTPEQKEQQAVVELVAKVGKLMILPTEQPVVATINEADKLVKEQAFYAGVQNGDKLIIFPKAQKAVIYSPSRNVIVNSGPFVVNGQPKP